MQLEAGLGEMVMDLVFLLRRLAHGGIFLVHKEDSWVLLPFVSLDTPVG